MKKCRLCGLEKALTDFRFRKDSGKIRSECINCCAERDKGYYRKNRKTRLVRASEYYKANRESLLQYANENSEERKNRRRFGGNKYLVFERDGYKCQICGSRNHILVHHKDENNHTKEIPNHGITNLETLCRSCHTAIHHRKHFGCKVVGCKRKHHAKGYCGSHQDRREDKCEKAIAS